MAAEGRWTLPQLQRQVAYDRLLQRLYLVDDGWVVKGATALMARDLGARATIDIDLYRVVVGRSVETDLRAAAARDLGDWFRFEIGQAQPMEGGVRLPARAFAGTTLWTQFHVDVVADGVRMTADPDPVPPLARLVMPDLLQENGYRAYPLVDHVADKVVATFQRYGDQRFASTRFKDLVDLVTIARGASVDADQQRAALASEAERRSVLLPAVFDVPDRSLWTPGYAAEARRSVVDVPATLDDALDVVRPFLDPVLDGRATGVWDPAGGRWAAGGRGG
jgi:hypothetical protein